MHRQLHSVQFSGPWLYLAVAGALVVVHGVRAAMVNDKLATRWLTTRGLDVTGRAVAEARAYLRRLRIARVAGAVVFLVLAGISDALFEVPIGVLSAPYLLSVLVAELTAPRPRQGRERVASLTRRPSDYFAPHVAVLAVRLVLWLGLAASVVALATSAPHPPRAFAAVHLAMTTLGLLTFEACLRTISGRGLPYAEADLQRDTAIRVASSRTCTAAALSFAAFSAAMALALSVHSAPGHWVGILVGQLMTWGVIGAMVTVVLLTQPVRSWKPRGA